MPLDYKKAGVNIDAGNALVDLIKPLAKRTHRSGLVGGIGGFGGLFEIDVQKYKKPVLVASTDGVGTKLKLAFATGIIGTVGIDLVAMNVNDIVTLGAEPLFFLDYYATSGLKPEDGAKIIEGIVRGCEMANCTLLGGETAELPGFYAEGEFELAGFTVGVVDRDHVIDGGRVQAGDAVLGLFSSGLHSNGYSLARKIVSDKAKLAVNDPFPLDPSKTTGTALLEPTIIYVKPLLALKDAVDVHALAHITGGGLLENPPRVLPDGLGIRFDRNAWEMPRLFTWLAEQGGVEWPEMFRVFNCGIGMIAIVPKQDAERAMSLLRNMEVACTQIGEVTKLSDGAPAISGLY